MQPNQDTRPNDTQDGFIDLQVLVAGMLGSHVRSFEIEVTEIGIVLHGACDSFHSKQMAQEIVAKNTSLRIAANNLIVDHSHPAEPIAEAKRGEV